MSVTLGVGARLPAFSASMGRVMLSGLDEAALDDWLAHCAPAKLTAHTVTDLPRLRRIVEEVRAQGYAWVEQELELGLCSLAVPVRNGEGRVAAAINVSMQYHPDVEREATRDILPQLKLTAAAIEGCAPSHRLPAVAA